MARRRFVQIKGELYEVEEDYESPARGGGTSGDAALWNDRTYQDGNDPRFSSRTQHRDYMRRHGLTTADDFRDQWRKDEARRVARRNGTATDPSIKRDVVNTIRKLTRS